MGMFDDISIAEPLPCNEEMKELGLDINNCTFQTKDLDCTLSKYVIQGSKLFIQKYRKEEWVKGDPNSKVFLDTLGHLKREDPYYEEVPHHGEIYFYDFISNVQDKWDCWVEYKAVFTRGHMTELSLFKFEKTDNTARKAQEKEWKEKITRESNLWYNKYILHTRPYSWLSRKLSRGFYRAGKFLTDLSYKI